MRTFVSTLDAHGPIDLGLLKFLPDCTHYDYNNMLSVLHTQPTIVRAFDGVLDAYKILGKEHCNCRDDWNVKEDKCRYKPPFWLKLKSYFS